MWLALDWAAWIVCVLLFGWMAVDFMRVNRSYDEATLLSSREGVDELFAAEAPKSSGKRS